MSKNSKRGSVYLKNQLIHDYKGINYSIVWDVLKSKIPELYPQILEIIEKK